MSSSWAAGTPAVRRAARQRASGRATALVTHRFADHRRDVLQSGHRRAGQGPSGPRDRCARRADGPGDGSGRHPVPGAQPSQGPGRARAHGPRPTAKLYRQAMQALLAEQPGLDDRRSGGGRGSGHRRRARRRRYARTGETLARGAVVLTTGTFLRGLIHIGDRTTPARPRRRGAGAGLVGAAGRRGPCPGAAQDRNAAAARRRAPSIGRRSRGSRAMIRRNPSRS